MSANIVLSLKFCNFWLLNVVQFCITAYVGDVNVWKSCIDVFTGILNLAIAPNNGRNVLFALSHKTLS